MSFPLFSPPNNPNETLQVQIREQIVSAILDGCIDESAPLPPSRKLAQQLQVGRNTVLNVYERLLCEGYLVSKERSGYYVNPSISQDTNQHASEPEPLNTQRPDWASRVKLNALPTLSAPLQQSWMEFEYPFIYNQIDPELFPVHAWRECCRDSVRIRDIRDWSSDHFDNDDPLLIEQIRKRILPRRGILAGKEQILVTLGSQHGLYLLAKLLLDKGSKFGIEDPGYPQVSNIAQLQGASVIPLPVDDQGLMVSEDLAQCDYAYVTPSHQCPTTVTMSLDRRHQLLKSARENNVVLIEDDYESEINFYQEPTPALKCLDQDERVIYIGSLSKTLAPGLRIGFIVAPEEIIEKARVLRHLMLRHPPVNNQRAVALFIKRGFHDSLVRKLSRVFKERCEIMSKALDRHLPGMHQPPHGGSSFWVQTPEGLDGQQLKQRALESSLLIQTNDFYFQGSPPSRHHIKLGFSAIKTEKIKPGIEKLSRLITP